MAKLCVVCGEDCSAKPRVKDETGNYACRECAGAAAQQQQQQHQQQQQQQQPRAAKVAVVAGNGQRAMATAGGSSAQASGGPEPEPSHPSVWDDLTPAVPSGSKACPSCGHGMKDSAVLCLNCGHNELTGKALRTKREKPVTIGEVKVKRQVDPAEQAAFFVPLLLGSGLGGFVLLAGAQQNTRQMAAVMVVLVIYASATSFAFTWSLFFHPGLAKLGGIAMVLSNILAVVLARGSPETAGILGLVWLIGAVFGLLALWKDGEKPVLRGMVCGVIVGLILMGTSLSIYGVPGRSDEPATPAGGSSNTEPE